MPQLVYLRVGGIFKNCATNFEDNGLVTTSTTSIRGKWIKTDSNPEVGDLCLIRSELISPNRWPLVRIVKLHLGCDGVIRVVMVQSASSELVCHKNRAITGCLNR